MELVPEILVAQRTLEPKTKIGSLRNPSILGESRNMAFFAQMCEFYPPTQAESIGVSFVPSDIDTCTLVLGRETFLSQITSKIRCEKLKQNPCMETCNSLVQIYVNPVRDWRWNSEVPRDSVRGAAVRRMSTGAYRNEVPTELKSATDNSTTGAPAYGPISIQRLRKL